MASIGEEIMKRFDVFTATRLVLVGLLALTSLSGCDKKPNEQTMKYNQEQQAKEKQASLLELRNCFTSRYLEAEDRADTQAVVAMKLRGLCEDEFVHFRAVKFHYAPVPDIISPPPKMVDEELGLVEAFVEKTRSRVDQFLNRKHAPSERTLPPGHPPINPHHFEQENQQSKDSGI